MFNWQDIENASISRLYYGADITICQEYKIGMEVDLLGSKSSNHDIMELHIPAHA